jgi:hypothetical protein
MPDVSDELLKVLTLDNVAYAVQTQKAIDVIIVRDALRLFLVEMASDLPRPDIAGLQGKKSVVVSENRLGPQPAPHVRRNRRLDEVVPASRILPPKALIVENPIYDALDTGLVHELREGNNHIVETEKVRAIDKAVSSP